ADVIVVSETPFGLGNLSNLRQAAQALDQGKRLAVIGRSDAYSERDFANGEVESLLRGLLDRGAASLESPDALHDWVAE
ncbi:MAG: ABC transporter ATP-binding protein, partial [Armatimonadetes bacterium]|nr:ABC transporter ATP-binding protein [Armatimonadota bacterium]